MGGTVASNRCPFIYNIASRVYKIIKLRKLGLTWKNGRRQTFAQTGRRRVEPRSAGQTATVQGGLARSHSQHTEELL